jgi:hypothetical protein
LLQARNAGEKSRAQSAAIREPRDILVEAPVETQPFKSAGAQVEAAAVGGNVDLSAARIVVLVHDAGELVHPIGDDDAPQGPDFGTFGGGQIWQQQNK